MQPFSRLTAAAARDYDAWYQTSGAAMAAMEERLLARLLQRFPAAHTLVDVGCGTGYFSRCFRQRGLSVVGLDPAAGMLAVAREQGGPAYVCGLAEALPFADGSFDLAAFVTSLEFVDRPERALREAARVARRGLLLGVLNAASPLGLQRQVEARLRSTIFADARFYTPWGLPRLIRRSLPGVAVVVDCSTAIWPRRTPAPLERLPFGAFIGMAVALRRPKE